MLNRALVLSALGVALAAGSVHAQAEGVTTELVARGQTDHAEAVDGPADIIIALIKMEPGTRYGGWHTHPGPVWVVVTKGMLALYGPDGCRTAYTAGAAYLSESDVVYDLRNETTELLELMAVGVIPAGLRATVPADDPMAVCGG